jgi:ferredoxin
MAIQINKEACTGCGTCVEVCSLDAITLNNGVAEVDPELCAECGTCVEECPVEAISLEE